MDERPNKQVPTYQCPECGLHYEDEKITKQCEAWCTEHKSCNLEITRFAVEVANNIDITIDPKEHSDYRWFPAQDAVHMLKYDGNKKSMTLVSKYAASKHI